MNMQMINWNRVASYQCDGCILLFIYRIENNKLLSPKVRGKGHSENHNLGYYLEGGCSFGTTVCVLLLECDFSTLEPVCTGQVTRICCQESYNVKYPL